MSPEEWYRGLPPLTKVYWSVAVLTTILVSIRAVNPAYLLLDWKLVVGSFQVR